MANDMTFASNFGAELGVDDVGLDTIIYFSSLQSVHYYIRRIIGTTTVD
jgi:hypothetical protein